MRNFLSIKTNMLYCRIGHCDKIFVSLGEKIIKGTCVGTVGTGNGQWNAHVHVDFPNKPLTTWTEYVFGMSKETVKELYNDPKPYQKTMFPTFNHLGWGYLDLADYSGKKCYHPGEDWNGPGAGNADFGEPIYAPFNGEVVYVYNETEKNGGWGKLLVIKQTEEQTMQKEFVKAVETITEKEYGDNLNDTEQKDVANRLLNIKKQLDKYEQDLKDVNGVLDATLQDNLKLSNELRSARESLASCEATGTTEEATVGSLIKQLVQVIFRWGNSSK